MNSVVRVLLALFTLHLSLVTVMAQTATNRLDSLQKEMYRLFSKQEVQEFNDVVEQLKAEALRVGDERAFYKAWANQANYNFTKQRQRGFDICRDMRLYAQQHNSKYGLYTSSYANAGMLSSLRQYDMAEKEYLECIEFLNSNFPDESKAPVYLSLAKIYQNQNQPKKVRECADIVIADPRTSKLHKLNALSYKCFSFAQLDGSQKEAFNKSYEERKRLQAEIGQEGFFSLVLEYEHSLLNGDYDQALEFANAMAPLNKKSAMARIYEKRGMYKEALHWYKRYRDHRDSVNIAEFRRQSTDHTMELNVQRAESEANEAKDESQNQFGNDHLLELMQQHLDYDAQQTIDMLREAVAEHVGNALPSDDLTMLCIKIKK